jgi:hypothetical protein
MHVLDNFAKVVLVAAGGRCVSAECPDCIYTMNPQVVGLGLPRGNTGACPPTSCGPSNFYVPSDIRKSENWQFPIDEECVAEEPA